MYVSRLEDTSPRRAAAAPARKGRRSRQASSSPATANTSALEVGARSMNPRSSQSVDARTHARTQELPTTTARLLLLLLLFLLHARYSTYTRRVCPALFWRYLRTVRTASARRALDRSTCTARSPLPPVPPAQTSRFSAFIAQDVSHDDGGAGELFLSHRARWVATTVGPRLAARGSVDICRAPRGGSGRNLKTSIWLLDTYSVYINR